MRSVITLGFIFAAILSVAFVLPPTGVSAARLQTIATPTPTPIPAATPTATPGVTKAIPQPTPGAQTIPDLQARIRERLSRPELRRGMVGVKIVSYNTGKVIYEDNAEKYFIPASNMKVFTVATAIEKLTPGFKFVTSVYAASPPDASGVVKGDLRIFGRGDVSISTRFTNGDYYKRLDDLADAIVRAGVKRVEGGLVGDETYFSGNLLNRTWEIEDVESPDGAEVSALSLNDNAVDISIRPGTIGGPCIVTVTPFNLIMRVVNQCITSAAGTQSTMHVQRALDQNVLEVTGSMPAGAAPYTDSIAVTHPAELFVFLLKQRLQMKGVTVTGGTRTIDQRTIAPSPQTVEIARLESPPLSVIAAQTMKPSQNMYTETLLRTLGEEVGKSSVSAPSPTPTPLSSPTTSPTPTPSPAPPPESVRLGLNVVRDFLAAIGVAPDGILQTDGSGMSRRDLITPSSVVQVYDYMGKQSRFSQAWRESLAVGGVDGTLRRRFADTKASGNFRGKTGTLSQVSALSGYMTTAGGEQVIVSMIVNGVPLTRDRTNAMDDVVIALANFNGRIDQ
jgi:D-alanyl-D-alanine carboxypeptidase/D-alanyl-D-alanine-endopeptidase (penicillin-binding protein 4)